jgi:hypothetical protein
MYNLTVNQREIIQWIVQNVREGNLDEEFTFIRYGADIVFLERGARNVSRPVPNLSSGALRALMESGLMLVDERGKGNIHCTLLGKAYEAVDSNFDESRDKPESTLNNSVFGTPSPKYSYDVFMLMPFAPELKPVYDNHIRKIINGFNLSIARADDFFSQNAIMEEIWSAIAFAKILIADCTNKNPNVFYEIGLAHAIGKPVILITQNPDDVPFDIRHRRYIQYAYTPPGMEKFEKDLSATVSEILKDLGVSL